MTQKRLRNKPYPANVNLAKNTQSAPSKRTDSYGSKIAPKAQSITRRDIASWQSALKSASNTDSPRRAKLQNLYTDIMLDAHLTSQIELRRQSLLATPFVIKRGGENDEELTSKLSGEGWVRQLNTIAFDSALYGHSVVEFFTDNNGILRLALIPRTNVVPESGVILFKEDDSTGVAYRNAREYGTWLLEFGEAGDFGLLNKAVPHVLFKKFAQACWSELCEIYGIPPRVLHTNTQDPEMLSRAESMMRDMGAAAWYLVDTEEKFEFATGVSTNGDVYSNLIQLCQNEISLLICGAVIGQDTKNGNRSKEEVSATLLDTIVQADKGKLEGYWNGIIVPALVRIGVVPDGCTFEFQPQENLEKLFDQTHKVLQYMDVDPEWIKNKFGIEVTGIRKSQTQTQLSVSDFFV